MLNPPNIFLDQSEKLRSAGNVGLCLNQSPHTHLAEPKFLEGSGMHDTNTSARASGSRAIENETGPRTSAAADASCCPGGPSGQPLCPCGGCPRRAGGKRGRGAAGSRLCEMERQGPPHGAVTGAAPWEPGSPYGTRRAFCCGRCQVCSQLRKIHHNTRSRPGRFYLFVFLSVF